MSGRPDTAASLRAELVDQLRQRLGAAGPADASRMRREFTVLAEDYRTLRIMDEMPPHAGGAHAAWRALVPQLPEAVSRRRLLAVLAEAYTEALEHDAAPPGGAAEPSQAGQ